MKSGRKRESHYIVRTNHAASVARSCETEINCVFIKRYVRVFMNKSVETEKYVIAAVPKSNWLTNNASVNVQRRLFDNCTRVGGRGGETGIQNNQDT